MFRFYLTLKTKALLAILLAASCTQADTPSFYLDDTLNGPAETILDQEVQPSMRSIIFNQCTKDEIALLFPDMRHGVVTFGQDWLRDLARSTPSSLDCGTVSVRRSEYGESAVILVRTDCSSTFCPTFRSGYFFLEGTAKGQQNFPERARHRLFANTTGDFVYAGTPAAKQAACEQDNSLCAAITPVPVATYNAKRMGWLGNAFDYFINVEGLGLTPVSLSPEASGHFSLQPVLN